jgi:hypothetical protein
MSAAIDVATRGTVSTAAVPLSARLRSAGVWIVGAVVVLITVIATLLMTSDRAPEDPLHYDGVGREGMKALVETLRDHGTEVVTTESLEAAREASARPDTTLLIPAGADVLSPGDVDGLTAALHEEGNRLVLVDPGISLGAFTDRLTTAVSDSPLADPDPVSTPACRLPAAVAAGEVSTGESLYAAVEPGDRQIIICYPQTGPGVIANPDDPAGQLVVDDGGDVPLTVLGNGSWLSNGEIDEDGNAALSLSTLSQTPNLVVYYPREGTDVAPPPSTIDFVPSWFLAGAAWLVPCLLVLLLVLGRRFGPLAVERLPVVVPAVETVFGRAALAERSRDRTGALHALRTAALLRIAARLALGPEVGRDVVLTRIAGATGRDPTQVTWAFVTAAPATDRELTEVVDLIDVIESEIP